MAPSTAPVLEARGLWKTYNVGKENAVNAVRGVNLTLHRGDYAALMGPSGSGKSTLLHLLGALDVPTKGSVAFNGRSLLGMTDNQLAAARSRSVGFVFQNFNLVPRISALENVMLPMSFGPGRKGRGERKSRAGRLLEGLGLGDRLDYAPSELSGGQRQRVAIARALANNPSMILADEPTGNLDSRTGEQILGIFDALRRAGRTILLVTHDASVGGRADKIYRMVDGHLATGAA